MKNKPLLWIILTAAAFLGSCAPRFPAVDRAFVMFDKMTEPLDPEISFKTLSPNGETAVFRPNMQTDYKKGLKQFNLETGEATYPFGYDSYIPLYADWSPDGRYLFGFTSYYTETGGTDFYMVFDTQTHSRIDIPRIVLNWSPFNTYSYITNNPNRKEGEPYQGVYNLNDQTYRPFVQEIEFTKETDLRGNRNYLWSERLDFPVAVVGALDKKYDPRTVKRNMNWEKVLVKSIVDRYYQEKNDAFATYQVMLMDDPTAHVIGAIFDPSGEFVLTVEWECEYSDEIHCSDWGENKTTDGVIDSIYTLIRWRTGERKELFRLSSIDPDHIIAHYRMEWSADGSTIVIWRADALPVVLKVK